MRRLVQSECFNNALKLSEKFGISIDGGPWDGEWMTIESVVHELAHWLALKVPLTCLYGDFSEEISSILLSGTKRSADYNELMSLAIESIFLEKIGVHRAITRPLYSMVSEAADARLPNSPVMQTLPFLHQPRRAMNRVRKLRRQPCIQKLAEILYDIMSNPDILSA